MYIATWLDNNVHGYGCKLNDSKLKSFCHIDWKYEPKNANGYVIKISEYVNGDTVGKKTTT